MLVPTAERAADTAKYGYERPAEVYEDVVYNFAFGSNIHPPSKLHQRRQLDTDAEDVGVQFDGFELAVLRGWRLVMDCRGLVPTEPSFASVRASADAPSAAVEGALLKLTRANYERLWRSEGGWWLHLSPYREVAVRVETASGAARTAIVFVTRPEHRTDHVRVSRRYKALLVTGAERLGVSEAYLEELRSLRASWPPRSHALRTLAARAVRGSLIIVGLSGRLKWHFVIRAMMWYQRGSVVVEAWRQRREDAVDAAGGRPDWRTWAAEAAVGALCLGPAVLDVVAGAVYSALDRLGLCGNYTLQLSAFFQPAQD